MQKHLCRRGDHTLRRLSGFSRSCGRSYHLQIIPFFQGWSLHWRLEILLELIMKIEEIPRFDRPREKAARYGTETLTDAELLAILINNGHAGFNALDIANELLTMSRGLSRLSSLNQSDLKSVKGINDVKSLQLLSLFTIMERIKNRKIDQEDGPIDVDYINRKYSEYLNSLDYEVVVLIVLNRQKKMVFEKTLYIGNDYLVSVSLKEIVKNVILHDGYYFYLVHNHPGGNKAPSPQDVLLTIRLNASVKKLSIFLLDHLIIYDGGYTSINEYLSKEHNYKRLLQVPLSS